MNTPVTRRYDIDALRALAFSLLIAYHLAMLYVADWNWHLKSSHQSAVLQWPMLFFNRWRMDLIFLISGVSIAFLLRKTGPGALFRQRSWRLLLPLLFGILIVVPIQPYCQGVANGLVEPGFAAFLGRYYAGYPWPENAFDGWQYGFTWNHLWYLVYLWCYTALFTLLQPAFHSRAGRGIERVFAGLRGWRLLLWPAVPILLFTVLLQRQFPNTNALINDWYAHCVYFTMFIYGWWLGRNDAIWPELARLRKPALTAALMTFLIYMVIARTTPDSEPPLQVLLIWSLRNLYIWLALCAILGWGNALLNRPFRWLPWATESVYPWYILHQSLIVYIAYWLVPQKIGPIAEPLLIGAGTVLGCWLLTALISRSAWLRPCFGMKPRTKPSMPHRRAEVAAD